MTHEEAKSNFMVGLLGESPNDTDSLQALLGQRYEWVRFVIISPEITGAQLDSPKFQHIIRANYRFQRPNLIVVTRDLDAPESDRKKRLERLLFFRKMNRGFEQRSVFLLNVQAMEALIAADIAPFDKKYGCTCSVPANPTTIVDPAKFLKEATALCRKHYDEGHCAELLAEADYDKLLANCRYFADFDKEFASKLPNPV
ncbi:DUF4276 family protein [Hymenobacter sp. PAMC 26628]|uniref:DUF4276 family protein n=1 Tax=Hymenobacter sp. PAMC 26628 TaxID=1484118 RepID=UPI000770240A|nr:DUF4276 family protein [Hymenobacter sp. PAMC 26628]AMJ64189.1 hypothetical protein AXW84_01120 [Hymenobacter sp. PAMC 26628]